MQLDPTQLDPVKVVLGELLRGILVLFGLAVAVALAAAFIGVAGLVAAVAG